MSSKWQYRCTDFIQERQNDRLIDLEDERQGHTKYRLCMQLQMCHLGAAPGVAETQFHCCCNHTIRGVEMAVVSACLIIAEEYTRFGDCFRSNILS